MKTLTVVPAYGRDYKSKAAVNKDFEADKDFLIQDIATKFDGAYICRREAIDAGYTHINIRYKNLQNVHVIKLPTKTKEKV